MNQLLVGLLFANFVFTAAIHEGVGSEATTTESMDLSRKDRVMGAIVGVLIGDALGVGSHWYYDLDNLKKDFGPWISDYSDPQLNSSSRFADVHAYRYQQGIRAGDVSQTGQLISMLLESIADEGSYDQSDFIARLDELFETLDGTGQSGLYTDEAIRETWQHRNEGIGWDEPDVGSNAITSEAAQMNVALAALYFNDPRELGKQAYRNTTLFYHNDFAITHSIDYALIVGGLIQGVAPENIKQYIDSVDRDAIRANASYSDSKSQVKTDAIDWDSEVTSDPPHLIAKVHGQDCDIHQLLPAAYYFIHEYPDDFEKAVFAAINGGGNNMARAALTGGMSGATVGLSGIPERLVEGLNNHERIIAVAERVAALAEP